MFAAHGKLLLTGEYFVLDGAVALAVPTMYGQTLTVSRMPDQADTLQWQSLDHKGQEWFRADFKWDKQWRYTSTTDEATADRLLQIFAALEKQGKQMPLGLGTYICTELEFPREWGLGTSSTLISLIAQLFKVDPYQLLADSFGGSGYDIACAEAEGAILYTRHAGQPQIVDRSDWYPDYDRQLHFVYLGQKQNSREGIQRYRERKTKATLIDQVTHLTFDLLEAKTADEAGRVLQEHEKLVSSALGLPMVQAERFADFPGTVKSLGAWGGDFALVVSTWPPKKTRAYFKEKGYSEVKTYAQMVY